MSTKFKTSRDIAKVLAGELLKNPDQSEKILKNFKATLAEYNLENSLSYILKQAQKIILDQNRINKVKIFSSHPLSADQVLKASVVLTKDREVEKELVLQEDLIGGVVVEHKYMIYDASLKNALGRLRAGLLKS